MSLELEQYLIEMGVIPASPLAELSATSNSRDYYSDLPKYDEDTKEYLF